MTDPVKPLGIGSTLALHLIPGALITAFFFLAAPAFIQAGYPPIMTLYLAILLILIPFELGYLLLQGKKLNGRYSLRGIVLFREPVPAIQLIGLGLGVMLWGGMVFTQLPGLDNYFVQNWFAWLPNGSLPANLLGDPSQYSKTVLTVTLLTGLALNGFFGPLVEELYFRGYLLPRIPAARWVAPLINVLLFSLYHFFSPWQNITRILALIPLVYAVAWKRNITISILAHCLLNTISMVPTLALLFR